MQRPVQAPQCVSVLAATRLRSLARRLHASRLRGQGVGNTSEILAGVHLLALDSICNSCSMGAKAQAGGWSDPGLFIRERHFLISLSDGILAVWILEPQSGCRSRRPCPLAAQRTRCSAAAAQADHVLLAPKEQRGKASHVHTIWSPGPSCSNNNIS